MLLGAVTKISLVITKFQEGVTLHLRKTVYQNDKNENIFSAGDDEHLILINWKLTKGCEVSFTSVRHNICPIFV